MVSFPSTGSNWPRLPILALAAFTVAGAATYVLPESAIAQPPPPFLRKWGGCCSEATIFRDARGITVGPGGVIYVSDVANGDVRKRIKKFDAFGNLLAMWGTNGTGDGEFIYPGDVAAGPDGSVWVADWNRIQKFDAGGGFLGRWGTHGSGDGEFDAAEAIAVSANGEVFVVDRLNRRIQVFDSQGQFLRKWGSAGTGPGELTNPSGIAIAPNGDIYIVDAGSWRIQRFDSNGVFLSEWGPGSGLGALGAPIGIAIDASGNVFVTDTGQARVVEFDAAGGYLTRWGSTTGFPGAGNGQFSNPWGIAVDAIGNVYVVDAGNARVQKFGSAETEAVAPATWSHIKSLYASRHGAR